MRIFSRLSHLIWGCLLFSIPVGRVMADEYADNLAKWNAMRPAHYAYRYSPGCYCPIMRWQVEAKAGTVVAADKLIGDGVTTPSDLRMFGMDSLFRLIERLQGEKPYRLSVTYDREFGFPDNIDVDPKQTVADDEYSIHIDEFKVILPGLTVKGDTVYGSNMAEVPAGKRVLALANTGDSAWYLNSIEWSLSPTDTFSLGAVALRIHRKAAVAGQDGEYYRLTGKPRPDTIAALGGFPIQPGDTVLFDDFLVDGCACLKKAGTLIASGHPFTSLLRFDLSRDKSGGTGAARAYAWFQGLHDVTTSIGSGRARLGERRAVKPGHVAGTFPAHGRYYGLDGRPPRNDRIPVSDNH